MANLWECKSLGQSLWLILVLKPSVFVVIVWRESQAWRNGAAYGYRRICSFSSDYDIDGSLRFPGVEFEVVAEALLMCRSDLPSYEDEEVDIILGQLAPSP